MNRKTHFHFFINQVKEKNILSFADELLRGVNKKFLKNQNIIFNKTPDWGGFIPRSGFSFFFFFF